MKYTILFFLIILSSCIDKSQKEVNLISEELIENKTSVIPEKVQDYLTVNFKGWRLVNSLDYEQSWWSFYDKNTMNFFASADINDDQIADYAFILKKDKTYQLVILMGSKNSFIQWIDSSFENNGADLIFGLSVEPPGRIDVIRPQIQSLILKSNGFNLMELENRACIYHVMNNEISVFKTK